MPWPDGSDPIHSTFRHYLSRARGYAAGQGLGSLVIRAFAGAGAVQVAGMLVTFLVGVQLARGLGVSGYGEYGIAFAVIALASVPGEMGVPKLVLRETAAALAHGNGPAQWAIIRWATRRALAASTVAVILIIGGILAFRASISPAVAVALLVGLPLVPLVAMLSIRANALVGLHEIVKGQVPTFLLRPLLFSILLFVLFQLYPTAGAPEAMALNIVTAIVGLVIAERWLRTRLPRLDRGQAQVSGTGWLASALAMALMDGVRVLQGQVGILLLGILAGSSEAGLFRVAVAIALFVAAPLTLLESVTSPIFARLYSERDFERLQRLASRAAQAGTLAMLGMVVPILLWGQWMLELLFGTGFGAAQPALVIMCAGQLINAVLGMNAAILTMSGHERRFTRAIIVAVAANTILAALLIPWLGAAGAAIASISYLLVWNIIAWRDAKKLLNIDTSILPIFGVYARVRK